MQVTNAIIQWNNFIVVAYDEFLIRIEFDGKFDFVGKNCLCTF